LLEVRVKDCGVGGSIKMKMKIKLKRKIESGGRESGEGGRRAEGGGL